MLLYAANSMNIGTHRTFFFPLPFSLLQKDMRSHMHIMGSTGMGKSKLLAHMAATQIASGIPTAVIDPHADLANDIVALLTQKGYFDKTFSLEKFLYIDFGNPSAFVPFNYLKQPYEAPMIARNFVEVCFRAWPSLADGNAPVFENLMLAAIPVLIANNLSLTALDDLLTNKYFREKLLQKVDDQHILRFFHNQVDKWGKETYLMLGSAQRRYSLILYSPALRYSLGQTENLLDFRKIIDEGISVVFNLGGLDKQTQRLIGNLLTVGFETAALSRSLPGSPRTEYHLTIDEFQNFSAQNEATFSDILSECRKYGLFLTLSHQNWSQVDEKLQGSMENVDVQIFFRVGYESAVWAAPRLFGFNQKAVKEAKSKTEKDVSALSTYGEQYEVAARELYEGLKPRIAYVRTNRTVKIQTTKVAITSSSRSKAEQIKEEYARKLLIPKPVKETTIVDFSQKKLQRKRTILP
jgi:hypothetical protein